MKNTDIQLQRQRRQEIEREVEEDLSQVDLLKELRGLIAFLEVQNQKIKVSELLTQMQIAKKVTEEGLLNENN